MRALFVIAFAATLMTTTGCAKQYVVAMRQSGVESGPDYILVQAHGPADRQRVYDCYSKPDGDVWNPTCVRVDLRDEAPAAR